MLHKYLAHATLEGNVDTGYECNKITLGAVQSNPVNTIPPNQSRAFAVSSLARFNVNAITISFYTAAV